jgi:hypothetical protein
MSVQKVVEKIQLFVKDRWGARRDFLSTLKATNLNGLASTVLSFVYPPLASFLGGLQMLKDMDFYMEYFGSKVKKAHYELELQPLLTKKHYFTFGYEIADDEIEEHLTILKTNPKLLGVKASKVQREERYREVGVDKDILTRHFIILGTTGAGKTSLLMVIFERHMSLGGGLIFVDGKAEEEMFKKLYSLASKHKRERDVFLINFLNTEEYKEDTNTFNPILTLPPVQAVSFLASLMGEAGGDQAYWQGRGKALLRPLIFFHYFRKKYWDELYSYENIQSGLEMKETTLLAILTYTLAKDYETKLKNDTTLERLYREGKAKATASSDFEYMQVLRSYFIRNPQKREEFKNLGYDPDYLEGLFKVYTLFRGYISGLSQEWYDAVKFLGEEYYYHLSKTSDIRNLSIETLRKEFDEFVKELKRKIAEQNDEVAKRFLEIYENPNLLEEAQKQHGFAMQQWTDIFSQIEVYSHIFGSTNPDIDFVDVIKNNKILYVLLPAMKADQSTVDLLGKMIVLAIKQACSVALGGKVEMSRDEKKIFKSRITPKPLGLVVLDEYGAYPVSGLDVIFAQVRSLNISFMVSVQDYQSLRPEGKDEGGAKRAWANSSKIVFLIKDEETLEKLQKYMKRKYITKFATKVYSTTDVVQTADATLEAIDEFDPRILVSAQYGFGLAFVDRPVLFQAYWADAPVPERVELIRFEDVE